MKSLHFDKELLEITITEKNDNDVFYYNIGKHVSTVDEYKQHIFVRDNTFISDVLDNKNVNVNAEDVTVTAKPCSQINLNYFFLKEYITDGASVYM